jgi:hypothetical protein
VTSIVEFYAGTGTDHRGRTIEDLWAFDHDQLERVHDYIQWLFPTDRPSGFNPWAPVLDAVSIGALRALPDLSTRVQRSLDLLLEFYGLRRHGEGSAVRMEPSTTLDERGPRWWGAGNHNHLRLTRIIASLGLLGLGPAAIALDGVLQRIRREHQTGISDETARYWSAAAATARTDSPSGSPPR